MTTRRTPFPQLNLRIDPAIAAHIRRDATWKIAGQAIRPADVVNAALQDFFGSWSDLERYNYYRQELERRTPKAPNED